LLVEVMLQKQVRIVLKDGSEVLCGQVLGEYLDPKDVPLVVLNGKPVRSKLLIVQE